MLIGGLEVDARGDTFGGRDPLGVTRPLPGDEPAPKATTLDGLSERELIDRVMATGVRVYDAERGDQTHGRSVTILWKRGTARGTVQYFSSAYALEIVRRSIQDPARRISYATDGQVAVLGRGAADDVFLGRVLDGLGATIARYGEDLR
jgi:hypothetical protein